MRGGGVGGWGSANIESVSLDCPLVGELSSIVNVNEKLDEALQEDFMLLKRNKIALLGGVL